MDKKAFGAAVAVAGKKSIDPTVVTQAVDDWLEAHPEATTTVQDGAISYQKLDSTLKGKMDDVGNLKTQIDDLEDAVATKANVDGSYPDMTVGNAEQLVATIGIEDAVPYNFRTAGGSADIGDREVDKIVGGTLAWNQLAVMPTNPKTDRGITASMDENGVITLSGTSTTTYAAIFSNLPAILNHVYLSNTHFIANPNNISLSVQTFNISWSSRAIYKNTDRTVSSALGVVGFAANTDLTGIKLTAGIVDLTQMFGSEIAEYILSLETATAGAGVAWFRKLFPAPYYAYNAGELMSVQTSAHKMVGFNQWDEEWQNGYYAPNTGAFTANNQYICSKNAIHVFPATTYYIRTSGVAFEICEYDANGVFLRQLRSSIVDSTFTSDSDTHYIQIGSHTSGAMTNYDPTAKPICINLSWDGERDGEYEPYQAWEYPLDSDLVLRGIPKLDAGNNLYYDGDTYESDGTVTRHMVELEVTAVSNVNTSTTGAKYGGVSISAYGEVATELTSNNFLSDKYQFTVAAPSDGGKWFRIIGQGLYIFDERFTDLATANSILASEKPKFVFEISTPTTETADPYQNPQIVEDFGTEEYVDTRAVAIPVGHDTTYRANLRAKLEMSPNSPDGDGDYIVRQANGQNEYVLLTKELPAAPSSDGNYILKCTVASGAATYTWEAQT